MNSTVEATVASKISTKMLDPDTRIGSSWPSRWNRDIRAAIPAAIESLATQASSITAATDAQIGKAFANAIRNEGAGFASFEDTEVLYGAWLRAAYAEAVAEPETAALPEYPEMPRVLYTGVPSGHLDVLKVWADNDTDDVKDGVDAQAIYLRDVAMTHPSGRLTYTPWGDQDAFTHGDAKDFLGAVMRYKKARLPVQTLDKTGPLTEKPEPGTRIRITEASKDSAYHLQVGEVAVVESVPGRDHANEVWMRGKEGVENGYAPGLSGGWVHWASVQHEDIVTGGTVIEDATDHTVEVDQSALDEKDAEIARLTTLAADRFRHHQADIEAIGVRLIEEATSRRWCSEYDTVVDDLNGTLHIGLPLREQEYDVDVTGYIRVPFSYRVTVTAGDSESAEEMVSEDVGSYLPDAGELLRSYTSSYDAEVIDDEYEYEVSES